MSCIHGGTKSLIRKEMVIFTLKAMNYATLQIEKNVEFSKHPIFFITFLMAESAKGKKRKRRSGLRFTVKKLRQQNRQTKTKKETITHCQIARFDDTLDDAFCDKGDLKLPSTLTFNAAIDHQCDFFQKVNAELSEWLPSGLPNLTLEYWNESLPPKFEDGLIEKFNSVFLSEWFSFVYGVHDVNDDRLDEPNFIATLTVRECIRDLQKHFCDAREASFVIRGKNPRFPRFHVGDWVLNFQGECLHVEHHNGQEFRLFTVRTRDGFVFHMAPRHCTDDELLTLKEFSTMKDFLLHLYASRTDMKAQHASFLRDLLIRKLTDWKAAITDKEFICAIETLRQKPPQLLESEKRIEFLTELNKFVKVMKEVAEQSQILAELVAELET